LTSFSTPRSSFALTVSLVVDNAMLKSSDEFLYCSVSNTISADSNVASRLAKAGTALSGIGGAFGNLQQIL